ncbi:MAG: glycosyltransferase family 2 protein [Microbacteriaceae bacterium]|nr:glycosyltransferase family 2 protein [Microbacteriaceae bacterium]
MADIEIPIGKRTKKYRFFEVLPALCSYGTIAMLVVLSIINPFWAACYLLAIIIAMLLRSVHSAYHAIKGHILCEKSQKVNWQARLLELEDPAESHQKYAHLGKKPKETEFAFRKHVKNLARLAEKPADFPRPSSLYNAVIVAAYNESYDVLRPTLQSLLETTYDKQRMIVVLAYEERGGAAIKATATRLQREFSDQFFAFHVVEHPEHLPGEVIGKGGNITFAGKFLAKWVAEQGLQQRDIMVTTLDSDNRPHPTYFDYVTYEYIVNENRKNRSYQPISLFLNNIWDAPAPMRVVATGNSFWNIISAMRPKTLRNFASHSQPLEALVEMDFWSTRTIVEDGHQYWRSYFHFKGKYSVVPIFVPIYQDAVLSNTYWKTLKAQFVQLRRWSYGASDVPYVAVRLFSSKRQVPFGGGFVRLMRLIDGHVTLATVAILVALGGWVPLLVNPQATQDDEFARALPLMVSMIQQVAMIGVLITVVLSFRMLPPRPARYGKFRNVFMLLQWVLIPITAVLYNAAAAIYAQARLATGIYLDKFDVTEKATHSSVYQEKQEKALRKAEKHTLKTKKASHKKADRRHHRTADKHHSQHKKHHNHHKKHHNSHR